MVEKQKQPNYQNFPKRGEGLEVRSIISAPEDYYFVSIDYAALEGRVIAMASKDESFCADIWANIDPHMYWAKRLVEVCPDILISHLKLNTEFERITAVTSIKGEEDVYKKRMKDIRQKIKSFWVFAAFYGSSSNSIYKNIENNFCAVPLENIETLFEEFWETYTGVRQWQRNLINFYEKNGYVQSLTGSRRRRAPLKYNEVLNTPIQSSSSYDICLKAGDRLSKLAYETNSPQFQYRIQVHDSLEFYIPKKSIDTDIATICKEMCNPIYDFINVPLEVEVSIGTNWANVEPSEKFNTTMWWQYFKNSWKIIQ